MRHTRYIKALIFLAIYFIISNYLFIWALGTGNISVAYGAPMIFGMVASIFFLYLFEHERLFKFAKDVEKIEEKKEKMFIHKFLRTGKIMTVTAIGIVGGPVFSSLSAHILIPKFRHKYILLALISIPSTIFSVGVALGVIKIIL